MSNTYWGIYCPQHYGSWHRRMDGSIYYYPAREIAMAHLETVKADAMSDGHLWEVVEFGQQQYVERENLPPQATVCTVGLRSPLRIY